MNLKEMLVELHAKHGLSANEVLGLIRDWEASLKQHGAPRETSLQQTLNDAYIELHAEWNRPIVYCPKCKKQVESLLYKANLVEEGFFDGSYKMTTKNPAPSLDEGEESRQNEFKCPHCLHVIATNESDATDFIEGDPW